MNEILQQNAIRFYKYAEYSIVVYGIFSCFPGMIGLLDWISFYSVVIYRKNNRIESKYAGAVSREPWAVSREPWAVSREPWAVSREPWAVSREPWAVQIVKFASFYFNTRL